MVERVKLGNNQAHGIRKYKSIFKEQPDNRQAHGISESKQEIASSKVCQKIEACELVLRKQLRELYH